MNRLLLSAIIGLIVVMLVVVLTENQVPFFKKFMFDQTCLHYTRLAVANGGLNPTEKAQLSSELTRFGFIPTVVNVPETAEWGTELTIEIQANYVQSYLQADLKHKDRTFTAVYKQKVTSLAKE